MSPNSNPRLVRAVLEYAESHGPVVTARKFNIDHTTVYRWRDYRAKLGAAWPTDQDIADWDSKAEARAANAARKHRYEVRTYLNRGPILIDATGSIRRLQALSRIGWTMNQLGAQPEMRVSPERISQFARGRHRTLHPETVRSIASLYERLTSRRSPIPTGRNADFARRAAQRKGWPSPLAWDDDTIDDPAAEPVGVGQSLKPDQADIDEAAVIRATLGERDLNLAQAERIEVVQRLHAAGWSLRRIEEHTGLRAERYLGVAA